MLDFFRQLFDTEGFPARWDCGWAWTPELGWLHIISDLLTWGAYTAIPFVLAFYVLRRGRDVPFPKIFWLFIAFIFACGSVHLVEATIFWQPWYRLSGAVKGATAVISWATVLALVPVLPTALRLRTPAEMEREVQHRTESLRESENRRRMLTNELDHRVKNNITAIMSLAEQSIATNASYEEFRSAFMGRLRSMARTHEALSSSRWAGANLRNLLERTLAPYEKPGEHRIMLDGPDAVLPARATSSLSMSLHELATNSVKYGSLSTPRGSVSITWKRLENGDLSIRWSEHGGPRVEAPTRQGFGTMLLKGAIEHDLSGAVQIEYAPAGLIATMQIPATALNEREGLAEAFRDYEQGVHDADDVLR